MRLAIRVESVADFLVAQGIDDVPIEGVPLGPIRKARVGNQAGPRRGPWNGMDADWEVPERPHGRGQRALAPRTFRRPKRRFTRRKTDSSTRNAVAPAVAELGTGLASDLFFAAERGYWTGRNRAARLQKARQDSLGLGWQNHDHHTYRSGRRHFTGLIAILEELGFRAASGSMPAGRRGGGPGARTAEESGIVVFADVDLGPAEVAGTLPIAVTAPHRVRNGRPVVPAARRSAAQAGMHHLECRFDFDAARRQLQTAGVPVLKPFTDLPYLKQAFTEGKVWPVEAERLEGTRWPPAPSRPTRATAFGDAGPSAPTWKSCNATRATRDSTRPASTRSFERPSAAATRPGVDRRLRVSQEVHLGVALVVSVLLLKKP